MSVVALFLALMLTINVVFFVQDPSRWYNAFAAGMVLIAIITVLQAR